MQRGDFIPEVSVVMAVYNGGRYLHDAIQSILNQSMENFEFIIIDDGSTDGSNKIIQEYANNDNRIIVISRENKGLVASLNEGILLARAELIARMDADDISLADRLEVQTRFLQQNPEVVCIGSYYEIIDEDGDFLTVAKAPTTNDDIQSMLIKGHTVICHPTAIYRKKAVMSAGGYDEKFFLVEDLDLWLRLGEIGSLANIPIALVKYRTNSASVSSQSGQEQLRRAEKVIELASKRRNIKADFQLFEHWRPADTRASRYNFNMKYGWWGFNNNNKKAAIKYAKYGIKINPCRLEAWKLYFSAKIKLKGE